MKHQCENCGEDEFLWPEKRELTVSLSWGTMMFVVGAMWFFLDRF